MDRAFYIFVGLLIGVLATVMYLDFTERAEAAEKIDRMITNNSFDVIDLEQLVLGIDARDWYVTVEGMSRQSNIENPLCMNRWRQAIYETSSQFSDPVEIAESIYKEFRWYAVCPFDVFNVNIKPGSHHSSIEYNL